MNAFSPDRARRTTSVSLDPELVDKAEAMGIDLSRACERGLADQVSKAERWLAENAAAIESWNDWVEMHGLPLAEYRQF